MKLIYLDWNVYTSIKSPKAEPFIGIKQNIDEIKKAYYFPYSSAHLDDLKKGYRNEEPYIDFTNKDLNLLSKISDNIFWYYDFQSNSLLSRKGIPSFEFEPYKEVEKTTVDYLDFDSVFADMENIDLTQLDLSKINLEALGLTGKETNVSFKEIFKNAMKSDLSNSITNPLNNIPDNSALKKPLENMLNLSNETSSLNDMMQGMAKFIDANKVDPTTYKELRTGFKETLKIPVDISNWKSNTWEKLDAFCINNMKKSFTDLLNDNLKEQKLENNYVNVFTTAYSLLDLFSFNPDKLNKKNTTANMTNDSFHALMAGCCDIFVTNDGTTRAKAKVIYDRFNLTTEILTPEEFLQKFKSEKK